METLKKMSLKAKMLILGAVALVLGIFTFRRLTLPHIPVDTSKETEIKQQGNKQVDELVKQAEAEAAQKKQEAEQVAKKATKKAEKEASAKKEKLAKEAAEKPDKFSKKVEKELGLKDKTKRPYKKRK